MAGDAQRRQKIALIALVLVFVLLGIWSVLNRPEPKLPVGPIEVTWPTGEAQTPEIAAEPEEPIGAVAPIEPIEPVQPIVPVEPTPEKAPPPKKPDFLEKLGIAVSGQLIAGDFSGGLVRIDNGVLGGVNFSELYCRAAAFAGGKPMPKAPAVREQIFEQLTFTYNPAAKDARLENLLLIKPPFRLSGELHPASGGRLAGHFGLSLTAPWENRCGVDAMWQQVTLPLHCKADKNGELFCALELKKLIESLSGVAAKTTEVKQKAEIQQLEKDIRKEREKFFKNRVKERPIIEEHDLRPLFLP